MIAPTTPFERLTPADLPACSALALDREWPREERKWRFLMAVGEVHALRDPDGGLAGTVVLTRYRAELIAVSMVLVAARFTRQGLGKRLMRHAIDQADGATLALTATAQGLGLYQQLGFTSHGRIQSHRGRFQAEPGAAGHSRPATPADLTAILELDLAVFGADRSPVLRRLHAFAEHLRVIEVDGGLAGFAAAWRNDDHLVLGPVVAQRPELAQALLTDLALEAGEAGVRIDVDDVHTGLTEWVVARGLTPGFAPTIMTHGGRLPADRSRLYSPLMQALG
ncbi:GNAT family N-acetyltransferase [Crossiella cryophila]|uniref:GNAT superfamily N-acetyltransferase n=1 Tax=Crossiella cryophila TaxID=43355 RepID=A0A7W7CGQ4_9PSEU|nr:GNAT family N-acetyltransferase [Crossiella cryophila]MBB4679174.1 GNAT superfamily N-acetyltransferase [Crossiella cryophila]